MKQRLIEILEQSGKCPRIERFADGGEAIVLPYGGRVLGLFAPGSDENFFWTHPALESPASAAEFFASNDWQNTGGDRTWLAPEVDFFFPNYPRLDVYHQPRALDPGDWRVAADGTTRQLRNQFRHALSRSGIEVELRLGKAISPAANPLRDDPLWKDLAVSGVQYAGYALTTTLEIESAVAAKVGLWNLLQMPEGGELLVPCYRRDEPRAFFGQVPPADLNVGDRLVRYQMRASGEQKLGFRATAVTGRAGYCYPAGDGRWALVVRNAAVHPSGDYVDVPWNDPNDRGYAIQACHVNSHLGRFSELEHHAPATTGTASVDYVETWAYRGPAAAIQEVSAALLGGAPDES